jgi:hypothetical protein
MQPLVDFFKNLPWYILYPGKAVFAGVGGYVSQNPQIFPAWAVLLGAAVALWVVLAFLWHAMNTWREHNKKSRLRLEPSHVIILGLAIALGGVVWQMNSAKLAKTETPTNNTTATTTPVVPLSDFAWGFERYPGYDFIGMSIGGDGQLLVHQFQAQGHNNTKDPIVKVRGVVRSDRTNKEFSILFNLTDGKYLTPDQLNPIPVDAIIDTRAYFSDDEKPIPLKQFLSDFVPFTFIFYYDGKTYRHTFTLADIEPRIQRYEQDMRKLSVKSPQMSAKKDDAPSVSPTVGPNDGVYQSGPVLKRKLSHREVDDLLDTLKALRVASQAFDKLGIPQELFPPMPPLYLWQRTPWTDKIKQDGLDTTIATLNKTKDEFSAAIVELGAIINADGIYSDETARIVGKTGVPDVISCLNQYIYALQALQKNSITTSEMIGLALQGRAKDCSDAFQAHQKWRNTFVPQRLPEVRKEIESDGARL